MGTMSLGILMCLSLGFNSCKTKEAEPEIPDFSKGYENVKPMPAVTPSTPAAVTSTPATVTASAALLEVGAALASGTVTPAVTKASEDIAKAVSPAKAAELVNAFTPTVLASLKSGGALPATLQADMASLAANPALAAYLPKVTPATVNGTTVNGFVAPKLGKSNAEPTFVIESSNAVAAINSACTDQAQAAYNTAVKTIDDSKTANEKIVNDAFDALLAAVNPESCKATAATVAAASIAQASALIDASIAGIDAAVASGALSAALGANIKVLTYLGVKTQMDAIESARAGSVASCDVAATAQRTSINAARTSDLAGVTASYNAAVAPLRTILSANIQTCHDQGMGGN